MFALDHGNRYERGNTHGSGKKGKFFKEKGALRAEGNNAGGARPSGSTGDQEREPGNEIEDQYQDFINPHEKVYHCVK